MGNWATQILGRGRMVSTLSPVTKLTKVILTDLLKRLLTESLSSLVPF